MANGQAILAAAAIGYVLGSIPFGLLLAKAAGKGDLRQIGSGNIGATNVLRTGSKGLAAAVLLLDAGKGFVAVMAAVVVVSPAELDGYAVAVAASGFAALVGHCYPIWLRFRGGKGVATMLGVAFAFDWRIGAVSALVWIVMALLTRISSVGGMCAAIAAPLTAFALLKTAPSQGWSALFATIILLSYTCALAAMALVVLWRHRANIRRLVAGEEPRVGKRT